MEKKNLCDYIGTIPTEKNKFRKKMRFHQGWWRTFVLNTEEGIYYATNKKTKIKEKKSVCNRINNGKQHPEYNFFFENANALKAVNLTKKEREENQAGIFEEGRLFNNLLSSQPLAFNFFGELKMDTELATCFIKTLYPQITSVNKVIFEYAPQGADHSAFDVGFMVSANGKKGFIGYECKYTDPFSCKRKETKTFYGAENDINNKLYEDLFDKDHFKDEYFSYVKSKKYNQLFRNELMGLILRKKEKCDFVFTGLFCHQDDKKTIQIGKDFQNKIQEGHNKFKILTFFEFIKNIQQLDILTDEQRKWTMLLWARYCGTELSKNIFKQCQTNL